MSYKYPLYHTYSSCTRCYPVPVQSSNKPCTVCTQNILFNKLIAVQFQIRPVSYDEKTLKKFVNNNKIKCRHIVKYSTVKSCTCICLYKHNLWVTSHNKLLYMYIVHVCRDTETANKYTDTWCTSSST